MGNRSRPSRHAVRPWQHTEKGGFSMKPSPLASRAAPALPATAPGAGTGRAEHVWRGSESSAQTTPSTQQLGPQVKVIERSLKILQQRAAENPSWRAAPVLEAMERLRSSVEALQALQAELDPQEGEAPAIGQDTGAAGRGVALDGLSRDVAQRRPAEETLQYRLAFERLLATISGSLIHLSPVETVRKINRALKAIGEFVGVERSYIVSFAENGARRLLYEWCAEGVPALMHELNDAPRDIFPSWLQSGLEVPMASGASLIGSLGLSSRTERVWTEDDVTLLKMGGEMFVNVLQRQRAERARADLEEKLRQAHKLDGLGRLAGGIAHDFNNQLTIIKGCAQFLLAGLAVDDPRRGDAERINSTVDRGAQLVRQLLAFSSAQPSAPQTVDLSQLVEEIAPMLRLLLGEQISLRVAAAPGLWLVRADPVQLERVIMNLVANAKDAMLEAPDGTHAGIVTVETGNLEPYEADPAAPERPAPEGLGSPRACVLLTVGDTGCGMTAEVRRRMFEPYFSTKPVGKGTGLGLSTAFGVIKQHGGHIWCDSQPGTGTTFKIYLPRVDSDVGVVALYAPGDDAISPQDSPVADESRPIDRGRVR